MLEICERLAAAKHIDINELVKRAIREEGGREDDIRLFAQPAAFAVRHGAEPGLLTAYVERHKSELEAA